MLCCVSLLNRQQVTEDSGTAPKSTLSEGQRANHSLSCNMSHITDQSPDPPLQLTLLLGCSWGHFASVLQIRKAAWVALFKQSKRIILFPLGISLSGISTNNDQCPQKKKKLSELMRSFLSVWNVLKGQGWLESLVSKAGKLWKSIEK